MFAIQPAHSSSLLRQEGVAHTVAATLKGLAARVRVCVFSRWTLVVAGALLLGACWGAKVGLVAFVIGSLLALVVGRRPGAPGGQALVHPHPRPPDPPAPPKTPTDRPLLFSEAAALEEGAAEEGAPAQWNAQEAHDAYSRCAYDLERIKDLDQKVWENTLHAMQHGFLLEDGTVCHLDPMTTQAMRAGATIVREQPPLREDERPHLPGLSNPFRPLDSAQLARQGWDPLFPFLEEATVKGFAPCIVSLQKVPQDTSLFFRSNLREGYEAANAQQEMEGGIFVPMVQFFRSNAVKGYAFHRPLTTAVFLAHREGPSGSRLPRLAFEEDNIRKLIDREEKARLALRTAIRNHRDFLVIHGEDVGSAAEIQYVGVLREPEFRNAFREVVFCPFMHFPAKPFNLQA